MNDETLNNLFRKAREAGPRDTSAMEFGFETRLGALLRERESRSVHGILAALGAWPWHLLPFFATLALAIAWGAWQSASDRELEIRAGITTGSAEWAFVEGVTGKRL
jgi:hypothetical protein